MSQAFHRDVPKTDKRVNRRLAFGVFAAPVAWFIHEVIGFAVIGRNCHFGGGLESWHWVVLVVLPVLTGAVTLAGIVVAYRTFRSHFGDAKITRVEGWSRVEFVSVFGVFFSSFLLLNIVYFGVMPFVVEPCIRTI